MVITEYSNEFNEQIMHKRRDETSVVHPLLVTNEPDLFVAVEDVIESFFASEEIEWKKCVNSPFPLSRESSRNLHSSTDSLNNITPISSGDTIELIGEAFLQHSKCLLGIHSYFVNLDPRRNCVKKVDEHSPVPQPLKLPNNDNSNHKRGKHGPSKKRQWTNPLNLEDKEIYKLLLKCVYHPPLDEPMPSPRIYSRSRRSRSSLSNIDAVSIEHNRLIQKPMRAFQISECLHNKLKNELFNKLPNQDITIALTDELTDQMARLESDECHLYRRSDFANDDFYEDWRRQKIDFVNILLERWCSNRGLMAHIARIVDRHDAFNVIVQKFLSLDLKEKNENMSTKTPNKTINSILTTESRKLLNEFCLWYGIDGLYRQLAILDAMVGQLTFSEWCLDWYLECLLLGLMETMDFVNQRHNFLVKSERNMVKNMLNTLIEKIEHGFVKLFYLYKKRFISQNGIETLVLLLQQVQQWKQLFRLHEEHDCRQVGSIVKYMELTAIENYRMIKGSVELNHHQKEGDDSSSPSAVILKNVLQGIKKFLKEAEDLANNCQLLSESCPNIPHLVAGILYSEYMKDVKQLCFLNTNTIEYYEVNYDMMGLAFRLNKLDEDWIRFIPPGKQKWRTYFKIVLTISIRAITLYLTKEVTNFILNDEFKILHLIEFFSQIAQSASFPQTSSPRELIRSIKLSDTSAFTSVKSIRDCLRRGSGIDVEHMINTNNSVDEVDNSVSPSKSIENKFMNRESSHNTTPALSENNDEVQISSHMPPANGSEKIQEVSCVVTEINNMITTTEPKLSELEEYIKYNEFSENVYSSPVSSIVHNNVGDNISDSVVRTCDKINERDVNFDYNTSEMRSKSALFTENIPALITNLNYGPKPVLISDTLQDDVKIIGDGKIEVDNRQFQTLVTRRCNSEPNTHKSQFSNVKSSAAAIRYVRDGPSVDSCLNTENQIYTHDDDLDDSCSDTGSTTTSVQGTNENNDLNNTEFNFPRNGQILTTSSVTDLLVSCSRLISFANTVCSIVLLSTDNESHIGNEFEQENYNIRVDIFYKVMLSLKDILESYATNTISLDNCGSKLLQNAQKYNNQLHEDCSRKRERIHDQDIIKGNLSVLPGCRHIREQTKSKHNSQAGKPCPLLKKLLVGSFGKWELVTRQMCFRINNVYSLIKVLPILQRKTAKGLNIDLEELIPELDINQNHELSCYNDCPCKTPAEQFCLHFKLCHEYFSKILHMQVKLLTCRVMDIFNKLFNELRALPQKQRSICEQMRSCLKYLRSQMKFFRHALYEKCVHMVVIQICKLLVEKFHDLLDQLHASEEDPHTEVNNLKDILMCTIRCLDADSALKQQINVEMRVILFRFQLFFLPLGNIRSLFDVMEKIRVRRIYTIEELIYLVKRELDNTGKSVFNGTQFQNILLQNEVWLNEFAKLLHLDVREDIRNKANGIGSYFLQEKYIKCCSVVGIQRNNLEVLIPEGEPRYNTVNIDTEGQGTSTQIDLSIVDDDNFSISSPTTSIDSKQSTSIDSKQPKIIIQEPQPRVGSEFFFARDNVNYRFRANGEAFASFLLLLLTGELYNTIRENGQWVQTATRKDIITIFRHEYNMNRTNDVKAFFITYKNISPFHVRRGSCAW